MNRTVKLALGAFVVIVMVSFLIVQFVPLQNLINPESRCPTDDVVTSQPTKYVWEFVRYESSAYEEKWLNITKADTWGKGHCPLIHSEAERADRDALTSQTFALNAGGKLYDNNQKYYSRMIYKCPQKGTYGIQLIEPLFGILRDPCDTFCQGNLCPEKFRSSSGQSKNHILPFATAPYAVVSDPSSSNIEWTYGKIAPWFCSSGIECEQTNALLMDLGASYFNRWGDAPNPAAAGVYFFDTYHKRNYTLVNYFAYEAQDLNTAKVFEYIPTELVGAYHWVNQPVKSDKGHTLNPWTALKLQKTLHQNKDVTIVKLDIDTPVLESALTDQLIEGGGLGIHEFFYEYHVNLVPLHDPWGTHASSPDKEPNLLTSYKMFFKIRTMGVRSHSWP